MACSPETRAPFVRPFVCSFVRCIHKTLCLFCCIPGHTTQANQATAAKAAAEVQRARTELEATQALLEEALQEKAAAVQEKAAGDALLRTEQGRGGEGLACVSA